MEWIWTSGDQVIDRDHPDWAFWDETFAHERRLEGEEPPPTAAPEPPPVKRLQVSRETAAEMLSISVDTFERRVLPDLRVVQVGRRQLVPIRELEDWMTAKAARALR